MCSLTYISLQVYKLAVALRYANVFVCLCVLQIEDYGVATGIEQHQLFHLFHRNFGNFNLQVGHNEQTRLS